MMTSADEIFPGTVTATAGVPLRVAAYMRISDAIRSGVLPRSSLLPSEADLGRALGVSRTVIREALILLEEDGLLRSRRGIGRFVNERLPDRGIERLEPFERILGDPGDVRVRRTERTEQSRTSQLLTDFTGASVDSSSWFIESVIHNGDVPMALTQEHLPARQLAGDELAPLAAVLDGLCESDTFTGASHDAGLRFTGSTTITVGVPGEARGALLGIQDTEPVIVLTRRLHLSGSPAFVSKTLINPHESSVTMFHTTDQEPRE